MTNQEILLNNEIVEYRNTVMDKLLSNKDLAELCLNRSVTNEELEDLKWKNYIPNLFVDGTITETQAYIMFDFNLSANKIDTFNNITLIFQIYCHKSIIRTDNGIYTRLDGIIAEINKMFKGQNVLGIGYNDLTNDLILAATNTKYTARQLNYTISDFDEGTKKNARNKLNR